MLSSTPTTKTACVFPKCLSSLCFSAHPYQDAKATVEMQLNPVDSNKKTLSMPCCRELHYHLQKTVKEM